MLVGLQGRRQDDHARPSWRSICASSGQKPLLVAADPYRVAAGEQLQALGKQFNVPVYLGTEDEIERR